jgi:PEP-CTERM motif
MRTQKSRHLTGLPSKLNDCMHRNESTTHMNYMEDSMQTQFTSHVKRLGSVLGGLLTACVLTLGVAKHASAVAHLDFDQILDGGTLSYNGTGGPLVGTDIRFDFIKGVGTPLNAGVGLTCDNCTLNFSTGLNTSESASTYMWTGGGSLSLTGEAKQGVNTIASGTLLTGTWDDPVVGLLNASATSKAFSSIGNGENTIALGLQTFYGLPSETYTFSDSALTVVTRLDRTTGGFNANIREADLVSSIPVATPEPGTLLLLSTGLIGMAGYGWRRRLQTARG